MESIKSKFVGLSTNLGNKQNYLGMDITFNEDKTVSTQMKNYIKEVIKNSTTYHTLHPGLLPRHYITYLQ